MSGKNPPGKIPPWGVRGRVRVRLGTGLGLGSGGFFPGGFFPRTVTRWSFVLIYLFVSSLKPLIHSFFPNKFIILIYQTQDEYHLGTQSAFTCSKFTIEALEQGVKYVQIQQ